MINYKPGTLAEALMFGKENDTVKDPSMRHVYALADVREQLRSMGHTAHSFSLLPPAQQDKITTMMFNTIKLKSPLLAASVPSNFFDPSNEHRGVSPLDPSQFGSKSVEDLYRLHGQEISGAPIEGQWARDWLKGQGVNPDTYAQDLSDGQRLKLARRMLKEMHRLRDLETERLATEREMLGLKVKNTTERDALHERLEGWANGPLRLEKPQGSSFHHLVEYAKLNATSFVEALENGTLPMPQLFVVDHDWDKAFSNSEGFAEITEWPLPYQSCCFEFRISGVRVLAFVSEDDITDNGKYLHCLYGRDGHWCADDIEWRIMRGDGQRFGGYVNQIRGTTDMKQPRRFEALTSYVVAQIRAVCIMLDSQVALSERQPVSAALNKSRVAKGKPPLRDHHVIRLSKRRRGEQDRTKGVSSGRHVRLHWRRGHWRHHDRVLESADPDVRLVEIPNESGIWTCKQWINCMLVGDESLGFVEKEYRL